MALEEGFNKPTEHKIFKAHGTQKARYIRAFVHFEHRTTKKIMSAGGFAWFSTTINPVALVIGYDNIFEKSDMLLRCVVHPQAFLNV